MVLSTMESLEKTPHSKVFSVPYSSPSLCRGCQFYRFQGCRGGECQKLGVPVRSHWRACSLALTPFAPSWELIKD